MVTLLNILLPFKEKKLDRVFMQVLLRQVESNLQTIKTLGLGYMGCSFGRKHIHGWYLQVATNVHRLLQQTCLTSWI